MGNVIQGIGFSGLVTFTGNQAVGDGNQSLSFGAQGTTTIDGGRITTGTIDAQRLNVGQINVTQTANYSTIQQNITGAAQQGITAAQQAAGQAVQAQQGVTAAQQAAQSAAGQAVQAQQGVVVAQQAAAAAVQTIPDQLSDLQNNIGAFTQPGQINVTQTNNYSAPPTNTNQLTNGAGFQTQAFTSPGQVNITQTQKLDIRNKYFEKINFYQHKNIIIDKFPLSIIEIGFIKCIFPNAKIILSLRHPCDL